MAKNATAMKDLMDKLAEASASGNVEEAMSVLQKISALPEEKNYAEEVEKNKKSLKDMTPDAIKEYAEELCQSYNAAYQDGKFADAQKIKEFIEEVVVAYAGARRAECFRNLSATADPMFEAIKQLEYPGIRATEKKVGDDKVPVLSIIDSARSIDVLGLHKYVKDKKINADGIGHSKDWDAAIQQLNFQMTARAIRRVTKKSQNLTTALREVNDSYAMSDIAKKIELNLKYHDSAVPDPTSDEQLLSGFQAVVNKMLGDGAYTVTAKDVNRICDTYARGKSIKVIASDHKYFRRNITILCHCLVTGNEYEVVYKKAKKQ